MRACSCSPKASAAGTGWGATVRAGAGVRARCRARCSTPTAAATHSRQGSRSAWLHGCRWRRRWRWRRAAERCARPAAGHTAGSWQRAICSRPRCLRRAQLTERGTLPTRRISRLSARMAYEAIKSELEDGILTITLDRPERLNAWTAQMCEELLDCFDRVDSDDQVRAVIVTGAGRGFCAGADLGAGGETFDYRKRSEAHSELRDNGGMFTLRIFRCTKPVIAAINGPAVGVGATMTLPMDVRMASTEARMGFVFARRGIIPEACSSWFLPRAVGISRAMEWVATGRVFPAQEG